MAGVSASSRSASCSRSSASSCSSPCSAGSSAAGAAATTVTAAGTAMASSTMSRAASTSGTSEPTVTPRHGTISRHPRVSSIRGMKTILVVDDEPKIVSLARDYLEHAGFAVVSASDGSEALARARAEHPDLIVLDLGLPKLDGLDVARALRQTSSVPIVILSGRADESDKLVGLELGADDYVTKPFSPKELVARVRAVLRRSERPATPSDVIRAADVTLDVPRMRVRAGDRDVDLTPTEFQLLAALAREPGRVFTRSQLLDAVHGVAFESYERAIDAHVKNIRRKLEADPREPHYLQTVHGVGYRFRDDEQ